jgi:oligopeptidase B
VDRQNGADYKRGRNSVRIASEGLCQVHARQGRSRTATGRSAASNHPITVINDYQIGGVAFSLNGETGASAEQRWLGGEGGANGSRPTAPAIPARRFEECEQGGLENRGAAVDSPGGVLAEPPLALRHPVEHVIHGDRRVDHYAWMRDKSDPRVREYLEAENAYADEMMRSTEGLREKLYQEMLGRIQQSDLSVPYLLRGYEYYTRTVEGKQYPIYCRRTAAREQRKTRDSGSKSEPRAPGAENTDRFGPSERVIGNQESVVGQSEEVLLDLNELAVGHTFMGLGIFEVSDDDRFLAYATDTTGYRQYVLEVKELRKVAREEWRPGREKTRTEDPPFAKRANDGAPSRTEHPAQDASPRTEGGTLHPFRAERVTSAAWSADGRVLFYVTEDEVTKRSNQLWRHEFSPQPSSSRDRGDMGRGGTAPLDDQDELVYEEKDERFRIDVQRARSGAYLFLVCNSHTTSEVRFLRADQPLSPFQLVAPRENDHEYYLEHHPGGASDSSGGVFFIRTNSGGRTYQLMTTPTSDPVRSRWREVIANRPKVMLSGLEAFRTHLVLMEREDGLPYLRIVDLTQQAQSALAASRRIEFAEPAYNAMLGANPEFDTTFVRFQYESMVTPRSVYDYEVKTGERTLRKQQPVLGGFDSALYISERLHGNAPDGTPIPISLVRRKSTIRDGNAPLLLYGYGSYGLSMPVAFSSNRLSLLDRGFVYAIAHIRGGGELGKPWHDAGRMQRKMATFTDFIACAEYLMARRYTSKERLVIEGGSAGGLLMGAVTNMRPDLFRVVVSHVPFMDVLNTMLDPSLPLTVGEYEEWGNPQVERDYFYMKRYCPYTNVERKAYPQMLVKTAWNDSQVMYWEAAKYVAKLRAMKTDGNALLLKTNMGAGHGGASGRYDFLREIALDYAFVLREVGLNREMV